MVTYHEPWVSKNDCPQKNLGNFDKNPEGTKPHSKDNSGFKNNVRLFLISFE